MSATLKPFTQHDNPHANDPRGPTAIFMCPICDRWSVEYVSCDALRDLLNDVLEEHHKECAYDNARGNHVTDTIKADAVAEAMAIAGWVQGEVERTLDLARRIQDLPEHQHIIRAESLSRAADLGKIVTVKPRDTDEYVTGQLTDFVSDSYNSYREFVLVIDGRVVWAKYDQEILLDNRYLSTNGGTQ